jgi:hypothetical protein
LRVEKQKIDTLYSVKKFYHTPALLVLRRVGTSVGPIYGRYMPGI